MSEVYVDQSANELTLKLFCGVPDLSQFSLLERGEIEVGDVKVRAFVIGASHMVIFEIGNISVCEVFSCTDIVPGDSELIFSRNLEELRLRTNVQWLDNMFHNFICTKLEYDSSHLDMLREDVSASNSALVSLYHEFPKGDSESLPFTAVNAEIHTNTFGVETLHAYPDENVIVATHTVFWHGRGE